MQDDYMDIEEFDHKRDDWEPDEPEMNADTVALHYDSEGALRIKYPRRAE